MTQTGSVAGGRLSDWISLGVLASWVPRDAVDEAVEATGKGAKRKGGELPPHVMGYFAMALALPAEEGYEGAWARPSGTPAGWGGRDDSAGHAGPWRKMSMDGLEWDVPATEANIAAFGFSGAGKDGVPAAFPKARAVTVSECASHAEILAAIGPVASKGSGEQSLARGLYPRLKPGWLLIADRNFYNWQDW